MPSPFDTLDTIVTTPEPPAPAAPEPTPTPASSETPPPSEPAAPDAPFDPVAQMNQRFDEFFKEGNQEPPPPVEPPVDEPVTPPADDAPPPPEDELETPDLTAAKAKMSMKAAEAFNKVKANAEAKLKELRTKLQELESKPSSADNDSKIKDIEARLAEKETKLAYYEVREHPEYKEAVEAPTLAVSNELNKIATRNQLEFKDLTKAMLEADPAAQSRMLSELAADMNERDKAKFWQLADDWEVIQSKEKHIRENATQAWQELQERQKTADAQKKEASTNEWKQASDKVWDRLAEKVPVLKDLDPNKLRADANGVDFDGLPVNDRAYAVAAAVTLVPMAKKLNEATAEIKQLKATLAKYQRATPGAGTGGSTAVPPLDDVGSGGFLESIEKRFSMTR